MQFTKKSSQVIPLAIILSKTMNKRVFLKYNSHVAYSPHTKLALTETVSS